MAWGSEERLKLLKQHEENFGVPAPALAARPILAERNLIYHEAFSILSSGRQNSSGVINPITFSDVMAYCDCVGEGLPRERLRYWKMVNACDTAWIKGVLESRELANAE